MGASVSQAIREQLVAAMEKRAVGFDGEARRVLDGRVAALRALPADALIDKVVGHGTPDNAMSPSRGSLRELVDSITSGASSQRVAYPELSAVEDFRELWSGIRSDSQLQQAEAQTPTNAGPLNSAALVGRSIALMREVSPRYLQQFLGYVDDLAWLEQMREAGTATTVGVAVSKKRARRKPCS